MSGADVDRTVDKWLSGFMANGSERRYGDRLLLVGGPGLSQEDVVRVVFGFVPMDAPSSVVTANGGTGLRGRAGLSLPARRRPIR